MDTIEIRSAAPADADAVERNHHRCFEKTYAVQLQAGDLIAPDRAGTRQQLNAWFQPGSEFETQVALADGTLVGHVTVNNHQLVHLFVEPGHQGAGLGRRLLALGEAMIAASGHAELELHTRVDNVTAMAFYEAMGWTVTGRLMHIVEHGISYDEHILVKQAS